MNLNMNRCFDNIGTCFDNMTTRFDRVHDCIDDIEKQIKDLPAKTFISFSKTLLLLFISYFLYTFLVYV